MKKDFLGWIAVALAFSTIIYLVDAHQRFVSAKEVNSTVISEINKNFKSFGFDYQIKVYAFDDGLFSSSTVSYYYDKVYIPQSKIKDLKPEVMARYILDIAPCQFTSGVLAKKGTRETRLDKSFFNNERYSSLSTSEISEIWNRGYLNIKSYAKGLKMYKAVPADQANNNVFYYFDPPRFEANLKNNLTNVMIESFKDKALVKLQNDHCKGSKL